MRFKLNWYRILHYCCITISLVSGYNATKTTLPNSPGLTIQQFDEYVRLTDVISEFGNSQQGEELWNIATTLQWDLSEKSEKVDGKPHSFIICHKDQDGKNYSGNDRRMIIHDVLKNVIVGRNVNIRVITNHKNLYCVYTRIFWSEALILEGLIVHPIHASMKILHGTIDGIEEMFNRINTQQIRKNDGFSVKGLTIQICPGYFDETTMGYEDEMELINKITDYIADNNDMNQLMGVLSSSSPPNSAKSETTHTEIWRDVIDKGIKEKLCQDIFQNNLSWNYDTAFRDFSGTSILNVKINFNKSEVQLYRICTLALTRALATMDETFTVELNHQEIIHSSSAQYLVQSGVVESRPWLDSGLDGNGQIIALSDTGIDVDNCYFRGKNRKIVDYISYADTGDTKYGHGTHCAGIIAGKRSNNGIDEVHGMADGIASGAKLAFIDCGDSKGRLSIPPMKELFITGRSDVQEKIAHIHSVSWGSFGNHYSAKSAHFDEYMSKYDDFLIVVAAGNSIGNDLGTITTEASSKNVISVGAHNNYGSSSGAAMLGPSYISNFSSRGPTEDGRTKPDILAPGKYLLSAIGLSNSYAECDPPSKPSVGTHRDGLASLQGTSMATSVVTGVAALIRQYFEEGWYPTGTKIPMDKLEPSSALVKAVLLNGGQFMKGVDNGDCTSSSVKPYDEIQNFGRASLSDSLYIKGKSNIQAKVWDKQSIKDNDEHQFTMRIDKSNGCTSNVLSATLTWMEEPSFPGCRLCVLNDLDLSVERLITTDIYFPNGLSQKDNVNNVERVRIDNVHDKELFILRVKASNLANPSQKYALVVTGCFGGTANSLSKGINAFDNRIEKKCEVEQKSYVLMIFVIVLMSFLFIVIIVCAILKCRQKMDGLR